jgi:DNA-binding NtrC family response regulator
MSLRAAPQRETASALAQELSRKIAGRSPSMQTLRERVLALASLDVPVLIRGDAGTGRTHVARVLYAVASPQSRLVTIACGDAASARVVPPAKRVVFLEEVDALAGPEQARWCALLRRVAEQQDGGPRRVLASTARDLSALARDGEFDPELATRLQRFTLLLPPLRDRRQDVADLTRALADRAAGRMGRARVSWTREALRLLVAQSWPGNVRELASAVERLVAFSSDGRINRAQVATLLDEAPASVVSSRRGALLRQREELVTLIDEAGGNLAEVARRLDMSRGGVIYRAQKFGLLPKRTG